LGRSEQAEAAIEALNQELDAIEPAWTPARFEECQFYGLLKGLTFTSGKRAIITIEAHGRDLDEVVRLKDAWQTPLVIGVWRV
jgi:hypothetical protein